MTTTELAMFGRALPLAPAAMAGRRPCAVCGLAYLRGLDAPHHLCPHCAEQLAATRAHVTQMLAGVERQIDALNAAEALRVAAITDDVSERWERMYHAWHSADAALTRARLQRWPSATPVAERAEAVRAARSRLEAVTGKITRTEAKGDALAPHITAWRAYQRELRRLQAERERWQHAADEVTCAEDGTPF